MTLLVPSGSSANPDGKHLFVIVNDACPDGKHALVSFSTIREGQHYDPTCVLEPGAHDFVKQRSFVCYQFSRIDFTDHLIKCVQGWTFTEKPPVSDDLLAKIIAGIPVSDFTPRYVEVYCRKLNLF